ncbi:hypothetical protein BDFB_003542 [Asbolus verrucosus]|uniref:DUF1676 domain containing protein n=1 Tax=Asbolus verrucosus TaxID=1661398 RepID=A0A482VBH3_ASBVE|nr:hypothetical protein BDFB_003542 [Asbolus verrucosus]
MVARLVVLLVLLKICAAAMDKSALNTLAPFRECLSKSHPGVCLKERALDALNETILSDKPFTLYDMVDIERNPDYHFNNSEGAHLPEEATARSSKLTDVLYNMIEEFFKSRVIKGKGGGGGGGGKDKGKGGMMILAMGGMACVVAQMFMGKIAFMAGTALVIGKVALFLSAIVGLKKLASGGGGGESSHVVYASSGDHGHSHGGGWHRSLHDAHDIAYRAHITDAPTGY